MLEKLTQAQLQSILGSTEGQRLMELLRSQSSQTLEQAAQAAKTGNYAAVQQFLNPLLKGTDAAVLAQTLNNQFG